MPSSTTKGLAKQTDIAVQGQGMRLSDPKEEAAVHQARAAARKAEAETANTNAANFSRLLEMVDTVMKTHASGAPVPNQSASLESTKLGERSMGPTQTTQQPPYQQWGDHAAGAHQAGPHVPTYGGFAVPSVPPPPPNWTPQAPQVGPQAPTYGGFVVPPGPQAPPTTFPFGFGSQASAVDTGGGNYQMTTPMGWEGTRQQPVLVEHREEPKQHFSLPSQERAALPRDNPRAAQAAGLDD